MIQMWGLAYALDIFVKDVIVEAFIVLAQDVYSLVFCSV